MVRTAQSHVASASRTAANTFASDGNLSQPLRATCRPSTQTVNSPRSPTTNSASTPSSLLIFATTRAALGRYDAQTSQKRIRTRLIKPPLMF